MSSRRKETGIWKAANGMWGVDFRTPDNHRHKYIVGPKQLAKDHLNSKKAEIFEHRYRPQVPIRMTFAELAAKNLESKRGRIAELTYVSDVSRTKELLKTLGPCLIDQITTAMIDSLLTKLSGSGLAGSTCNRYRALLSSHFSFAVRTKLLTENPVRGIPQYKEPDGRQRFLSAEDDAALFAAVRRLHPEREGELILILHCGLRKGGMFALCWQDVDLDERQMFVHSKGTRYPVMLNDEAVAALRDLHARSGGREKVTQSTGYARSNDWLAECIKAAGIEDFTPHDLRHTFGSRAIKAGADLCSVSKLMGHNSILTTQRRYVHLTSEHLLAQAQKLVKPKDSGKEKRNDDVAEIIDFKAINK